MVILIIAGIMAIAAIRAGVGMFYSMLANYLHSLSVDAVEFAKYIPYLEYGTMIIIIAILIFQSYQILKVQHK